MAKQKSFIKMIKQIFCKHTFIYSSWHYTHGINCSDPLMIEYKKVCKKCGKEKYGTADRNSSIEGFLIQHKELNR